MKKFIAILFIIILPVISMAHIGHYNKFNKIEMEIFRNGELIGYNYYFFEKNGDETIITNQLKFSVIIFGATIFEVESYGEEKYIKNQLISYNSKTLQNKKEKFVKLKFNQNSKKFDIKGSSYNGEAPMNYIIGNWWNHKILKANKQISPLSGSIKEQVVSFVKNENLIINGQNYSTDHYKLKSKNENLPDDKKLNFDIWYNEKNNLILKVSYSKMGKWEYKLKNFE